MHLNLEEASTYTDPSSIANLTVATIKLVHNNAVGKGGRIFAINAIVNVFSDRDSSPESVILFDGNTATMGGGIFLELAAERLVIKSGNDYTKTI